MKSRATSIWFALAVTLAAGIWLHGRFFTRPAVIGGKFLPGLRAGDVTEIRVTPAGGKEIAAVRTNNLWQLQKPFAYPAQAAAIAVLLDELEKVSVAAQLTPAELGGKNSSGTGLESPRAVVDLAAGAQQWHFLIGSNTAPGDQVFARTGADGALVVDSAWLKFFPTGVESWRDSALVSAAENCDWIVITNGARVIELRRGTNQHWRMVQPLNARASSAHIAAALQQLATAQAARFVTDDSKADLATYGLEPAALDVWLGHGTNFFSGVHAGKIFADDTNQIYIRRDAFNSVAVAAKEIFAAWTGEVNDFRDSHLLELHDAVAEIAVSGPEVHYTLAYVPDHGWTVAGEKFSADANSVLNLVKVIAAWRAAEFVKDVVTATDLEKYGLANPSRRITFRGANGTNVVAEILFGNEDAGRIFVKRGDEDFIYALDKKDFDRLPENGWEFRTRRVWNFSETNVASITLRQGGQTRTLLRHGTNDWSLAANQGAMPNFNALATEETVRRLGALDADAWVPRTPTALENYGFQTNNPQLAIELKSAEKFILDFGNTVPQTQSVFAATQLDGERWPFVFPVALTQLVAQYLTLPAAP
jgi:hypothetical protein